MMNNWQDMVQLSKILETEWKGGAVDRKRARELALSLMPGNPEIRHSLRSIADRMGKS